MAVDDTEINNLYQTVGQVTYVLTFKVKEYIGSIILEHLSNKFDIHVLDVDLLVSNGTCISARFKRASCR